MDPMDFVLKQIVVINTCTVYTAIMLLKSDLSSVKETVRKSTLVFTKSETTLDKRF